MGEKVTGRRILQGYFSKGNEKGIRSIQTAFETYQDLMEKPPAERATTARQNLPHSLKAMRENSAGQEAEAKWLLSVYHRAYPTVAPGDPPLTRDVADAWIAMDNFLRSQLWGQRLPALIPVVRARYDGKLASRWKTYPKEKRYRLIRLPAEVIEIKHRWPKFSLRDRQGLQIEVFHDPEKRAILLEEVSDPLKQ
jgi:hypothetical protein